MSVQLSLRLSLHKEEEYLEQQNKFSIQYLQFF